MAKQPPKYYTRRTEVPQGQAIKFREGKGYYAGGKAAPTPKAKASLPNPNDPYGGMTNQQIVAALQAPGYADLASQEKSTAARDALRQQALTAFTTQLQQGLRTDAGNVGAAYDQAAAQTQALSQAAAASLAAANPNAKDQALLDAIGAPEAQKAQLAQALNNSFNGAGAVTGVTQGLIPGSALAANRAAAVGYANALPGAAALAGQQAYRNFQYDQSQNDAEIAAARAKLQAEAPGLMFQTMQGRADYNQKVQAAQAQAAQQALENKYKEIALNQNSAALGLKTQQQAFDNKVTVTRLQQQQNQWLADYNRKVNQFNASQKNANVKASMASAAISGKVGYLADANGNPITDKAGNLHVLPGFRVKGGQIVKVGSPSKTSQLSARDIQKYKGVAATIAEHTYKGFDEKNRLGQVVQHHEPIGYGDALNEMDKEGVPIGIAVKALAKWYHYGDGRGSPLPAPTKDIGFRGAKF